MHLNPVIKISYITTPTKLGFQTFQRVLCHPTVLWGARNENTGPKYPPFIQKKVKVTETYNVQTQTFFLGFIRSHWWQLVLHFVMYCHVTSDTIRKDLAWCHLRSLWFGQTTSSLEKNTELFKKFLRRKTSSCDNSHREIFGRVF